MHPFQNVNNLSGNIKIISIGTVKAAARVVEEFVAGSNNTSFPVPFKSFSVKWGSRTDVYREFDILCHVKTTQITGWVVCKHAITELYFATDGTKRYNPEMGSLQFHRHPASTGLIA